VIFCVFKNKEKQLYKFSNQLFINFVAMNTVKLSQNNFSKEPSLFALLIDNISEMSKAEQKLLWMQLNQKKLSATANKIDNTTKSNSLSENEINLLITEAKSYVRRKKKS
jgi:hypothetical protein